MTKIIKLFFIIFLLTTPFAFAQTILLPEEEAPESIFSISPGGTDVDLFLLGTWKTGLRGGFGFAWNSENPDFIESSFPGMISGVELSHSPDIFISLWLMNSYFFETSFIDDYELNTILFGYQANDENFIQSVRIGNTDIGFGEYSYLNIPEASTDSLGGMALFKNDKSEHQLMLRYDPAEMQVKHFIGHYEVAPTRTKLTNYIKGRYFILPDNDVDNLKVYIEDSSGTYTSGTYKYRIADSNDAIISAEEGIVFFREPLNKRVVVHYSKSGLDVGNVALGISSLAKDSDGLANTTGQIDITGANDNFSFSTDNYLGIVMNTLETLIDGSEIALLLYEPGTFSPFEMLSVYSLSYLIPNNPALFYTDLTDINISVGDRLNTSLIFEDYMVRILYNGESFRDPANRYPLADKIDIDALIYEQNKELTGSPADKELLFQRLFPSGSYYLGDNVLDGSVSVTMNGFDEYKYTFNPDSGNVTFLFPVPTDAQIEIKYRTMASSGLSGDLLVALGSKFNFSDNFSMETGLGLRWNILDSSYIEQPGDASGSIIGTAGLSYKGEYIDFKLDAGVSVYSPNTTGILRLAGMNSSGFRVPISANFLYPSAPSVSGITTLTRGILYYKDFHEYDSAGTSSLRDYNWSLPSDQIYAYEDGGRTGPYIVGTGTEIEGDAAVIEYELGNTEWTGGRIPITLGQEALDLSSTQSITLKWKHSSTSGSINMYLRVGKLAEDLDDDGIMDEELSPYASGFNFNDGSFSMKVGLSPDSNTGNDQIDTEDLDGNNILDGEGSNLIFTKNFTGPDGSWETLTLNLNPSEREQLKAVTGLEIIIEDSGSGSIGKLLVGDIIFSGSSFITKPGSLQEVSVKEVNELYSSAPIPLLTTIHPEVSIFSSGTGAQNIAEITWDTAETWEITKFTEPVDLSDYNKISFFLKTPVLIEAPSNISFSLTNPSGEGISISFPPEISINWVKYTLDYSNGTLSANNTNVSGVVWNKRDIHSNNANRLSLSAICPGGGSLFIDEVYMEDPVVGLSGAASTIFDYKYPGTLISYKNTPVISNFNFGNSSSIKAPGFGSGFTDNKDSTIYTASNLGFSLLNLNISGNLNLQWQNTELYTSPGLSFTLPLLNNSIILNDNYNEVNLPLSSSTLRESSITTKLGLSSFIISANSSHSIQNMIRNWGLSSNTTWETGSVLTSSADFRMSSIENPYEGMNFLEKFSNSYAQYLPENSQNDRNSNFSISPTLKFNSLTLGIEESLGSNTTGLDDRVINSSQMLSINGNIIFNAENLKEWNLIPNYKKQLNITDTTNTNNNFFTDTSESIMNIGTQNYYFKGIPFWEILYPEFASVFYEETIKQTHAEYTPNFSIGFSRLAGSRIKDIFIPTGIDLNLYRNLNRDFDSLTDSLNINFETRATALNIFGRLGTTPIFNWYQTEEITNFLALGGEFRSYETELFKDPVFSLNYSLYLNFSLSKKDSIDFQSSHNWEWAPSKWNSSSSGSYNWQIIPEKVIIIPIFYDEKKDDKPYFEHKEKLTLSTNMDFEQKENSFTLTVNHSTDLLFTDKGNISIFAGIGFDQKSITISDITSEYYLIGIEAGISAMLTF